MRRLANDPALFAADALRGFAAAHEEWVVPVPGGVVRAHEQPRGTVAIVMGGGSGHFPAFAGWVGPGFGHAAVCGSVFASPSEAQVLSVARAADAGGGLLFAPINYAGDILHFGAAAERLRGDGVDVRMVPITDDIASAPSEAHAERRGIAGSFLVLKIAGAAAERGLALDEVERVAARANAVTRSFGVAFSGCTLPGSEEPLFTVREGRVALGLGIHGEPGIAEIPFATARDIADALVDGLLEERPPVEGQRVACLVDGLGATKYDELFLLFDRIRERIEDAGMILVAPVVGEQVTSLDMAGASLSLAYLDAELEELWLAPASIPSFSRSARDPRPRRVIGGVESGEAPIPPASDASRADASGAAAALGRVVAALRASESDLGALDAVAGDGDHGAGMVRGATAAEAAARGAVRRGAGLGTTLRIAGAAWSDEGGGTSGALWGAGLTAAGTAIGDEDPLTLARAAAAAVAFREAIAERGHADVGDKTMMDAIAPFAAALQDAAGDLAAAWSTAAGAARRGADDTAGLSGHRGRSRMHGDRSLGTPDPGAISFALVVEHVTPDPLR